MSTGASTRTGTRRRTSTDYLEGMEWKRHCTANRAPPAGDDVGRGHGRHRPPTSGLRATDAGVPLSWDPTRPGERAAPARAGPHPPRRAPSWRTLSRTRSPGRHRARDTARRATRTEQGCFSTLYWPDPSRVAGPAHGRRIRRLRGHARPSRRAPRGRSVDSPYDLVMVDEFQDASHARARLTRALVDPPGRHLLAVGDDWQSINRFAGADLSVLTHFHDYFGPGPDAVPDHDVPLSPEHRRDRQRLHHEEPCPASQRPSAPSTRRRQARRARRCPPAASPNDRRHLRRHHRHPHRLDAGVSSGTVPLRNDAMRDRRRPRPLPARTGLHAGPLLPNLRVAFRTVHSAKGLEADYVIVPNLTTGPYGFPIADHRRPSTSLAMADPDHTRTQKSGACSTWRSPGPAAASSSSRPPQHLPRSSPTSSASSG